MSGRRPFDEAEASRRTPDATPWLELLARHVERLPADVRRGGVVIVEVRHDDDCRHWNGEACDCDVEIVSRRAG
ncbi:MAG TPA: hypothetical protein VMM79_14380 [Longimicrobiales bacterium]|nr:hypothetical protein [Longimicrobiales bacterium]